MTKQIQVTLDDSEWQLIDSKIGLWKHKHYDYIFKNRFGVYDLNAINFKYHYPNTNIDFISNYIPSRFKHLKITKFPHQVKQTNIYLKPNKKYTTKEIIDKCKFAIGLDYEYLGQEIDININTLLKLCHTGK